MSLLIICICVSSVFLVFISKLRSYKINCTHTCTHEDKLRIVKQDEGKYKEYYTDTQLYLKE